MCIYLARLHDDAAFGKIGNSPISGLGFISAAPHNSEESVLPPVGSPTIPADPVLDAVLLAPPVELNCVVSSESGAGIVHVDSARVRLDAVGVDIGRDRASGIDLGHDIIVTSDGSELREVDLGEVGLGVASVVGITVHASVDSAALHVLGLVLLAGYIRNAILVNPSISSI